MNGVRGLTGALRVEVLLDEAAMLVAALAGSDRADLLHIQARLQDIIAELRGMLE